MILPNLPKLRKHKERDITPDIFKWFEENYPKSVALEIKIKGGRLKPHQPIALKQVTDGVFSVKLPDMGRRNPFDGIILKDADAFIVICDKRNCIAYDYKMTERFKFKI